MYTEGMAALDVTPKPLVKQIRFNEWFQITAPLASGALATFAGVWALSGHREDVARMRAAQFTLAMAGLLYAVTASVSAYQRAEDRVRGVV